MTELGKGAATLPAAATRLRTIGAMVAGSSLEASEEAAHDELFSRYTIEREHASRILARFWQRTRSRRQRAVVLKK